MLARNAPELCRCAALAATDGLTHVGVEEVAQAEHIDEGPAREDRDALDVSVGVTVVV